MHFLENFGHIQKHIQKSAKSKNVYNGLKIPEVGLSRRQNGISAEPYPFGIFCYFPLHFKLKSDRSIRLLYINGKPLKSPFGNCLQNLDPEKNGSGNPVQPVHSGLFVIWQGGFACFAIKPNFMGTVGFVLIARIQI